MSFNVSRIKRRILYFPARDLSPCLPQQGVWYVDLDTMGLPWSLPKNASLISWFQFWSQLQTLLQAVCNWLVLDIWIQLLSVCTGPLKQTYKEKTFMISIKLELIVTVSTCTHGNDGYRPVRWNPLHSLQLQIRTRQRRDVQVHYSVCNYRRPSFELRPRPLPILRHPT